MVLLVPSNVSSGALFGPSSVYTAFHRAFYVTLPFVAFISSIALFGLVHEVRHVLSSLVD